MPVAQLDRTSDYESEGWEFDFPGTPKKKQNFYTMVDNKRTFITIYCIFN